MSRNATPIRRKFDAPGPGGGPKVYVEAKERAFFRLAGSDLLDTGDLCRLYRVSARTIYRWMAEHDLRPTIRIGREYLFRKDTLLAWDRNHRPTPGRPMGS